jgi:hypothetical protein
MRDRRYEAMMHAVDLARTGRFSNWWSVAARLRAKRYREADVDWTRWQREWLDRLCAEARCAVLASGAFPPCTSWGRSMCFCARRRPRLHQ